MIRGVSKNKLLYKTTLTLWQETTHELNILPSIFNSKKSFDSIKRTILYPSQIGTIGINFQSLYVLSF